MPKIVEWTKEEDEFLIENYHKMSLEKIALHTNKSIPTVNRRAKDVLNLGKKTRKNAITDNEKDFTKNNWNDMSMQEIANSLGININRVHGIYQALKKDGEVKLKRKKVKTLYTMVTVLKNVKNFILEIENFNEADMYDIADEVEEILEVVKERLQEGIE